MKAKNVLMRALPIAAAALIALSSGCALLLLPTRLKIANNSGTGLEFVTWNGTSFSVSGAVYEPLLGYNVGGIANGSSVTEDVSSGTDYIYFELPGDSTDLRTSDSVTVAKYKTVSFTFTGSTQVSPKALMTVTGADGSVSSRVLELVPAGSGDAAKKAAMDAELGARP